MHGVCKAQLKLDNSRVPACLNVEQNRMENLIEYGGGGNVVREICNEIYLGFIFWFDVEGVCVELLKGIGG